MQFEAAHRWARDRCYKPATPQTSVCNNGLLAVTQETTSGRSIARDNPANRRKIMTTDFTMALKAEAKHDSADDLVIASVWLVLYLVMLVGTLSEPALARAVESAALY
jgi:hypothetical protein